MRRWNFGWSVVLVALAWAGVAQACGTCNADLSCASGGRGGQGCLGDGISCFMLGRCFAPGVVADQALGQVTLLADSPALAFGSGMRRAWTPDGVAVGRQAARLAGAPAAEILYSASGIHEGGTAAFRSPLGDGFTLGRESDGRGAWLTVCALAGERAGRVLARERLDENEALVVRVPFGGRTRVLVVGAATLPVAEAQVRMNAARRELRASVPADPAPQKPPFELKLIER